MTTTLGLQAKLAFVSVFMCVSPISQSKLDEARGVKNTVIVGEGGDEFVCVYDAGGGGMVAEDSLVAHTPAVDSVTLPNQHGPRGP